MATVRAPRPAPGRLRSRHLAHVARHLAHNTARIARFSIGIVNAAFIGILSAAQQHVLQDVYAHCTDGREDLISQQIEDALDPDSGTPHVSQCVTASGYTHRWHRPDAGRHMSVNDPSDPGVAHSFPAAHCPSVPRRLLLR